MSRIEFTCVLYCRPGDLAQGELPADIEVSIARTQECGLRSRLATDAGASNHAETTAILAPVMGTVIRQPVRSLVPRPEGGAADRYRIAEHFTSPFGRARAPFQKATDRARSGHFSPRGSNAPSRAGCSIATIGALPGNASRRNAERSGFRIACTRTKGGWGANEFTEKQLRITGAFPELSVIIGQITMPLAFPRGVLVLLFTGMAYAADPVGVVAKVVGEWTYQRGVATAGEAIFPGDRFAPTGDGPHQIVAIRYDTGSTERRNCDSGTPCVPFSLNPGPADATTVPTGIGRMLDYFSGSRKLPPVYAQSRSLALPVPDSSLLPETAIPEAAPGTVDFGALIQRTPETPSDFTFLVQTPEGAELLRTRLTERNAMRLADVHPGVYVVRIVGHEAVATSIVAVFPAEAAARARQSLDLLKRDVDQWDAQSELDQVARQTLFLNALINLEARP